MEYLGLRVSTAAHLKIMRWKRVIPKRVIQNARTIRLQTLEMVAVYMTEKACERTALLIELSKIVNLQQVNV